jgi:hypothetical protein
MPRCVVLCALAPVHSNRGPAFLSTSSILVSVAALIFRVLGRAPALLRVLVKHALAGAFDSEEVKILTDAFDQAWKAVEESGVCFASNTYKNATREVLALRIIEIAQLGERDPNRLRDDALLYLARTNLKSTGL